MRRSLSDGRNFKLHVLIFDIIFQRVVRMRVRVAGMRAAWHIYKGGAAAQWLRVCIL